ncbi:hypothetical protein [Microbulbifer yueqingensis]|uniref:Uncharacterized protein n=1 Tax=Microbulbifer yueqingensis TaxID=658219 RepID=A0A1G9ELY6_9GAMM|nr:hypothetical protein [Microbulbifer yueqingensis]SDK77124.1 hypothetical protein SAMN05216212_3189 [Microbulbifer yueqingensis]
MSFIKRWLLTLLFFSAAVACYVFGIPAGGAIFLMLGMVFEGIFWTRLFKRKSHKV